MKEKIYLLSLLIFSIGNSQNINVNNNYFYDQIRFGVINGDIDTNYSQNIKPLNSKNIYFKKKMFISEYEKNIFKNKKNLEFKTLELDYNIEFNSHHPYNRNNGIMLPNKGYQHILSPGLFFKAGFLTVKFKPEHFYSQNKNFDGFWTGHEDVIWAKRYVLWNRIDMPERHGFKRHNKTTLGQSNIKINYKNLSFGISNENLWWGPSIRNSIMMSNNAAGFKHITLNTNRPIETFIGNFEFQFITGRLESSRFNPPEIEREYAGTKLFVPKINQNGLVWDWRYLQGYIISYSPKWMDGLSLGFIRWVQMYSALLEGKYTWLKGKPNYFPIFENLFRKNDKFVDYEEQIDEAAGFFLKWKSKEAKAEFYFEFHYNDAKNNLRDLLLDTDHSRAVTVGAQKIFKINNNPLLFSWEWTQMEQTASRLIRNASSWYEHGFVYDGFTNRGEVLGSSIGPGSNSHYFSIKKVDNHSSYGLAFEIVDNDNDFYYDAFASAQDFRRYWKDFNLHLNYSSKFKNTILWLNFVYNRSLNYQWELDNTITPYYHPGRDEDNFHISLNLSYFFPL